MFHGLSREANFRPRRDDDAVVLVPHYDVVDRAGLELQWTGETTLVKLEAVQRWSPSSNSTAWTAGVEHTLYGVGRSAGDLGLLAEVMVDNRDTDAMPTVFDRDVFLGLRWARNDVGDTSVLGGPVVDLPTGEIVALFEAQRRLGDRWRIEADLRWFAATDAGSPLHGLRRDGHLSLTIRRYL